MSASDAPTRAAWGHSVGATGRRLGANGGLGPLARPIPRLSRRPVMQTNHMLLYPSVKCKAGGPASTLQAKPC